MAAGRFIFLLGLLICIQSMGACRAFTPPAQVKKIRESEAYLVHFEATRRGTYVAKMPDGSLRIAAEPPPDAALSMIADFAAKIPTQAVQAEASARITETIVKLGERTQSVIILRDAMFRLAEMYMNQAIDDATYQKLYSDVLEAGTQIALAELTKAQAELKKAQTENFIVKSQLATQIQSLQLGSEITGDLMKQLFDSQDSDQIADIPNQEGEPVDDPL